ncbi:oxygen-independent coproporphyrinogen-3 oxidase [Proteiniborus ethanoligenes]|uniref:Heme chaperone HemW n=1 Tax=Proteiniborus ethanoligenes TaxID=415015 RepID=A0A1H3R289_9FIRM|nr:radical SAM family heme chaperone HemW [Proteiniborus ethanoligenes]TAH63421.1 MAG: oxygen-independent coproporphyrinogen III oxidase [Gottschalkiaceae bacterium]SDZ19623.1 oxygen-independent coproporphyrinogen-3 oxidase [Proteiniborus ethanoligenes]
MGDIGIYVHIPFCQSKCYYCDFCSYPSILDNSEKYISYLKREIDIYEERLKDYSISTIFLGGGTPTAINGEYIYEIMGYIHKKLNTNRIKEVSIESNPKTLDDEKLNIYKNAGINRISLGVQSMNDTMLNKIGRIHTAEDFINTYRLIRKHGFDNVNFDIMFNLPGQTIHDSIKTLGIITELEPEHISYYSLKIEEDTPFYHMYMNKQIVLPDEDTEREMYHKGIELLEKKDYIHYEISNFAKKGYESRHNLIYWRAEPYIGLGLSAHSYFEKFRYGNTEDLNIYFEQLSNGQLPIEEKEFIDDNMEVAEYIILGLRLMQGVNIEDFRKRFCIDILDKYGEIIDKFIKKGLLEKKDNNIKLTKKGLDLCNLVFMEILP